MSGERLGEGRRTSYPTRGNEAFCPGSDLFAVAVEATGRVELFSGDMAAPGHRVAFTGDLDELRSGSACLALERPSVVGPGGLSLPIGGCPNAEGVATAATRAQRARQPLEVCRGTRCYRMRLGNADRYIRVTTSEAGSWLWDTEMRFLAPANGLAAVAVEDALVVIGARPHPEGGGLFAVSLDGATGRERWTAQVGHDRVTMFHYNGRHVVVAQRALLALDPTDGRSVWRIGR